MKEAWKTAISLGALAVSTLALLNQMNSMGRNEAVAYEKRFSTLESAVQYQRERLSDFRCK